MDSAFPIPVWDEQTDDLAQRIDDLRAKLGVRGDIVSSESRDKTIEHPIQAPSKFSYFRYLEYGQ